LYVSNEGSNSVSGFDINPATGFLTLVPGSPFATGGLSGVPGGQSISLECAPNGQFLFAANEGSNNITVFSIAANGALSPVAGSPFPAGGFPVGEGTPNGPGAIKVTPNGQFLSVALPLSDRVALFSIASDGTLTPVPGSPFLSPAIGGVTGVEINCAGNFLFAPQANGSGTNIDVFSISPNGMLTLVQTSNNPGIGNNSNVALLSPNQRFLFVSNQNSNSITVFDVASNGILSLVAGSPFGNPGGDIPQQLATNQAGTLLYANNANGVISVISIASNGALSPVAGSPSPASFSARPGIAAFPPAACGGGAVFDVCLQDDSNGNILRFNSMTGNYLFTQCRTGFMLGGTGRVTIQGSIMTLQHSVADRMVLAQIDNAVKKSKASLQVFSSGTTLTIMDRNTTNNTCACP
jgi:DNA-binding beta-propeller fold protein YncE